MNPVRDGEPMRRPRARTQGDPMYIGIPTLLVILLLILILT
jgi:hypothetical protein